MELEQKQNLLHVFSNIIRKPGAAELESNDLKYFLPLDDYIKAADPKTYLIIGDRGTGKTKLFHVFDQEICE
ncbi:MAG: hypothetical protein KH050_01250 [Clostridiaceae bacterium]|nr:hypothetical protein [Clostridiaceae bacterium]